MQATQAKADDVRRDVAQLFRPPRRRKPADVVAEKLFDFKTGQRWDAEAAPYMVEPINSVADRELDSVVLVGPSRSSKTFSLVLGGITYVITCDPADTTIIHMNKAEAEDFSATDLRRTIQESPDLLEQLGPAAGDDNLARKLMRNGMALRIGHPSIGVVSGKTIKYVFITDADNITGDLKINRLFVQARKRTQTFLSAGCTVAESNPMVTFEDAEWSAETPHAAPPCEGLLSIYAQGDRRQWYWPCPHCGEFFRARPGLSAFRTLPGLQDLREELDSRTPREIALRCAMVMCDHCSVLIGHEHKRDMNLRGRWLRDGQSISRDGVITGTGAVSKIGSFWVAGVMACYQSWVEMLERYLSALKTYFRTGDDQPLAQLMGTDFAYPHVPMAIVERTQESRPADRREKWLDQGVVPVGARYLVGTVDVQGGAAGRKRFVIQVVAHGVGDEKWLVDRFSLRSSRRVLGHNQDGTPIYHPIDPAGYVEDWNRLEEKVICRSYPVGDGSGRQMEMRLTLIDSGGEDGVTPRAYEFWRALKLRGKHHKVRVSKGDDAASSAVEITYPDQSKRKDRHAGNRGDVPVARLGTTILKDGVFADLARTTQGPGYYHLPEWLSNSFFDELRAEHRGAKRWERDGKRANETIDLLYMDRGATMLLGADRIDWTRPPSWAAEWDRNSEITAGSNEPRPIARQRPRVTRSKYLGN